MSETKRFTRWAAGGALVLALSSPMLTACSFGWVDDVGRSVDDAARAAQRAEEMKRAGEAAKAGVEVADRVCSLPDVTCPGEPASR